MPTISFVEKFCDDSLRTWMGSPAPLNKSRLVMA